MATITAMVAQVKDEGGIDASDATIKGWLHDRIERLIVGAKWRRAEVEIATTVAGDTTYATPANVVDVMKVKVNGIPYDLASVEELWDLKAGTRFLRGPGGVFAPYYDSDEVTEGIELWRAPDVTGQSIVGLCAVRPPTTADGSEPPFPPDLHHGAVEGAIADGLARMDERLTESAQFEAKFDVVLAELERRRKSKIGSGPVQIRVPTY